MTLDVFAWLKRAPKRPDVAEVRTSGVQFVGEQDGPVEQRVKAAWTPILAATPKVSRAFLVRALYADSSQHVVLALCNGGSPDMDLVRALRVPYAAIFSSDCPLDMAFVSAAQEAQIARVCPPFYAVV